MERTNAPIHDMNMPCNSTYSGVETQQIIADCNAEIYARYLLKMSETLLAVINLQR